MKLYHSPGSCSLGILVLLEEVSAEYEIQIVDLKTGMHRQPAYLAQNPKGKVPALDLGSGAILTEFPVIAYWIAKKFPECKLLPHTLDADVRVMEMLEYIVSSLHMRGSVFAMVPQKFSEDESARNALRKHGQTIVQAGFEKLESHVRDQDYLCGSFSIADAAAFYLLSWSERLNIPLQADLSDYFGRLQTRPAFKRALLRSS